MADHERMLLRATFGDVAELYDRSRPGYPPEMFSDLQELAGIDARSRALEIGCGTGQATVPLARLGCAVTAVELSENLAGLARRNLAEFGRAQVEVAAFEEWTPPAAPFDLVLSATAFHWVDPDVRVTKAADTLRLGGTVAVVSTHHVAGGTGPFFVDVQRCYERFDPDTPPGLRPSPAGQVPRDSGEFDRSGRFGRMEFRDYEWEQAYTTAEYLDLLCTYSNHRALPADAREGLLDCIGSLIDGGYDGHVSKPYLTRLAVAQRIV